MGVSYPDRRTSRLQSYDYASEGAYFVMLCIEGRLPLLGRIADGRMHHSPAGAMVHRVWAGLGRYYPGVVVDEFVVMPNHLHGIIVLMGSATEADRDRSHSPYGDSAVKRGHQDAGEVGDGRDGDSGRATRGGISLSAVVGRFKSFTAHEYGHGVAREGWPRYSGRLWQHRFHDRVVRNDRELNAIREYIACNPVQWHLDRENPERQ